MAARACSAATTLTDDSQHAKKTAKRSHTGCRTCRRRKKKCDEQRPECGNCEKAHFVCEGYDQKLLFETRDQARKARKARGIALTYSELRPAISSSMSSPGSIPNIFQPQNLAFSHDTPSAYHGLEYSPTFDFGIGSFGMPPAPSTFDIRPLDSYEDETRYNNHSLTPAREAYMPQEADLSQIVAQEKTLPQDLPFLIKGVETELHRHLFYYFTHTMSRLLTISNRDDNPMNVEMIPLAMRDRNVMEMVLCLAASHRLKSQQTGIEELRRERNRLHKGVCDLQSRRLQDFDQKPRITGTIPLSVPDQDVVIATSLLLCLYERCEGATNGNWKTHLDRARQALTMGPPSPESDIDNWDSDTIIITEVNPFLLEYFNYHDSIATVTLPSLTYSKPRFRCSTKCSPHHRSLIGATDGLCTFVARISAVRALADASPRQPDGNVVAQAVDIWHDLDAVKSRTTVSSKFGMIAQIGQWALWIWLYSIVYPDGKADAVIQNAVQLMAAGISEVKTNDGAMSCLLFPLFITGSAAIKDEDRITIDAQFRRLKEFCSFDNVDVARDVVKKMWAAHDMGLPNSWDWVKQLESNGMSILII
ncbi:Transcriptional regulatory protein [Lachnellula occidentalis]|uniref:Transcriptional regulatory protein n=1 Tax=Lachnellula occidentalis TaxID=215460 RepID=A0A8H8U935_9HELO|nr:Transcriptional regulatory protein [Lachnellula occidentalis]